MIVDFHCHAGRGDGLSGPWSPTLRSDRISAAPARPASAAPWFSPASTPTTTSQRRARPHRRRQPIPHRLRLRPPHARRRPDRRDVGTAVRDYGFRGVKSTARRPPHPRALRRGPKISHPVLFDVIGRSHVLHLLAPQYPDVPFVVAHLGSFWDDWRAQQQMVDILARYPNVYADTSGRCARFDYLVEAVRAPARASSSSAPTAPGSTPASSSRRSASSIAPGSGALIMGGNAQRLMRRTGGGPLPLRLRRGRQRPATSPPAPLLKERGSGLSSCFSLPLL